MKTALLAFVGSIVACSVASVAHGADKALKDTAATFISAVNNYPADASEFESPRVLTVKGRFGEQHISSVRLLACQHSGLKRVVAMLTKSTDTDVEIPRISTILYDSCSETVKIDNKGDIEIKGDATGVEIRFKLVGLGKTHWKGKPTDSVFVGPAVAVPPVVSPTSPGPLPCGGKVSAIGTDTIAFKMCSKGSTDLFYPYALHMDQIGSDNVSVDIGIDPLIINRP